MLLSHRRNRHVLLTCMMAAAVSTALALTLTTRADAWSISPNVFLADYCANQQHDASAQLGYPDSPFTRSSGDASYSTTPCGRYIVDIFVEATPGGEAEVSAQPSVSLTTPDSCSALRESLTVYDLAPYPYPWKATTVASGNFRGTWSYVGGCSLTQVVGSPSLQAIWEQASYSAQTGTAIWRVAASAYLDTGSGRHALPVTISGNSFFLFLT
jgi:hypothetical protein